MKYVWVVIGRLGNGWEAWTAFGPSCINSFQPTKEEAYIEYLRAFKNYFVNQEVEIKWFDPKLHFSHADTGYIYEEGQKPELATFLSYTESGLAKVMLLNGEVMEIDPEMLKPMTLYRSW